VQQVGGDGQTITVHTTLIHTTGEWIRGSLTLTFTKPDPQAAGSAITYAKRYGLAGMVGIVAEDDDDGNAASRQTEKPKEEKPADPEIKEWQDRLTKALYAKTSGFKNPEQMGAWIKEKTGKTFKTLNAAECEDLVMELAKKAEDPL